LVIESMITTRPFSVLTTVVFNMAQSYRRLAENTNIFLLMQFSAGCTYITAELRDDVAKVR
jgi:hypothetical protein